MSVINLENGLIFLAVVCAFWVVKTYVSQFYGQLGNTEQFALFGDYIGGTLNPLLTFITIVLLIRQVKLQSLELQATRQELIETKSVHKESVEAQKNSLVAPIVLKNGREDYKLYHELLNAENLLKLNFANEKEPVKASVNLVLAHADLDNLLENVTHEFHASLDSTITRMANQLNKCAANIYYLQTQKIEPILWEEEAKVLKTDIDTLKKRYGRHFKEHQCKIFEEAENKIKLVLSSLTQTKPTK